MPEPRVPHGPEAVGRLVFPQGKEEICKEEVVESQGAAAESHQTDLQIERQLGTV